LVCEFARSYPDVQVQINASARQVDLRREGYDVALRASTELEPGLVARTLTRGAVVAVASPAYLEARGTPKTVRDLRAHNCLLGFARDEQPQRYWPRATRSGSGKVQVDGSFVTNDISLLTEAAVRGLGIALLPIFLVGPLIERGVLVQVLKDVVRADTRVSAVYHEKEFIAPQVRAFVDALVAWAATGLKPPGMVERCNDTKGRNRHAPQTKKAAPKRVRPTRRLKAPSSSP
jgi:DNA-binding transcriptional LysR family regulator